jgi:hypothetical protein
MSRYGCTALLKFRYLITKALTCKRFRSLPFKWEDKYLDVYYGAAMVRYSNPLCLNIKERNLQAYAKYYDWQDFSILVNSNRHSLKVRIMGNFVKPQALQIQVPNITTISELYRFVRFVAYTAASKF